MILNNVNFDTYFKHYPNAEGYFGKYGGCYDRFYLILLLRDCYVEI